MRIILPQVVGGRLGRIWERTGQGQVVTWKLSLGTRNKAVEVRK